MGHSHAWMDAAQGPLPRGAASIESGVRSQESGVRSQESGVRSQESGNLGGTEDTEWEAVGSG
jgi:hypothetical protein